VPCLYMVVEDLRSLFKRRDTGKLDELKSG
jgi:hypothetical protein